MNPGGLSVGWVVFLVLNETTIRFAFFFGVLLIMEVWEILKPKRPLHVLKFYRWINNMAVLVLDILIVRLLLPITAMGVAYYAQESGWGLFQYFPLWLSMILSVIFLDLAIYLQHRIFHAVPLFWRVHRMHHADFDIDVTTGIRFHPIEIVLSMLIKCAVVMVLGVPVIAVLLFEVILNATSLFNHSNISLPLAFDRLLRWFIVTPDMHRVHHSVVVEETNSNYGFNLSCWDRLFNSYRDQPIAGHQGMTIGLKEFRTVEECVELKGMLLIPFVKK